MLNQKKKKASQIRSQAQAKSSRVSAISAKKLADGVLVGDRTALGKAITLIESTNVHHQAAAKELLKLLMSHTGKSLRLGITGVPGAGKSTFIEALGMYLIEQGHRVAVLAIDPSSDISRGSILGDKTRMTHLAQQAQSFIRPSPSGGVLGGVARKTRESILICEAAGYDVIIVETMGVGQSEILVRSMVDFFLLMQITGSGDELQGIKKGVIEIADAIVINKADGENKAAALSVKNELTSALHYLSPATPGWTPRVFTASALTGEGIPELWKIILDFKDVTGKSAFFQKRRQDQALKWFQDLLKDGVAELLKKHPGLKRQLKVLEKSISQNEITPPAAADELLSVLQEIFATYPDF